jgi:DeoR family fructose operon transcriptional repressor
MTDYSVDDARVKRAAMKSARRTVVLVDQGKLGQVYFARVAAMEAIDAVITDADPDHPMVGRIEQLGVEVISTATAPAPATA